MIFLAVNHIANHLNQYLRSSFDLQEDVVVVSNLLEQDGTPAANINNKLLLFLINVEKDAEMARHCGPTPGLERSPASYPPLYLNLYLVFTGNFTGQNYPEALKFLSQTSSYFQRHPVFDHNITPDLDRRIEKLVLEFENVNLRDLSNLWGAISGRYLPSIVYKVRSVIIDNMDVLSQAPAIKAPGSMVR